MHLDRDITDQVEILELDGDDARMLMCACGASFLTEQEYLMTGRSHSWRCPKCGICLYLEIEIKVMERVDG